MRSIKSKVLLNVNSDNFTFLNEFSNDVDIKGIEILNVNSIIVESDVETMTDLARVAIPKKHTLFRRGDVYLQKSKEEADVLYRIKTGEYREIIIYTGYDPTMTNIFRGYVVKVEETEEMIILHCEDRMNELKRLGKLKQSFTSPIPSELIDVANQTDIDGVNSLYVQGSDFMLHHLVYWIMHNIYGGSDIPYQVYCCKLKIGKLRIKDFMTPSEILKMISEIFGIYTYFRNEYNRADTIGTNVKLDVKGTPTLYIGWKYWGGKDAIDINKLMKITSGNLDNPPTTKLLGWGLDIPFSYPYSEGYDIVIDNQLEWVQTDKETTQVYIESVQDADGTVLTYTYPETTLEYQRLLTTYAPIYYYTEKDKYEYPIDVFIEEKEIKDKDILTLEADKNGLITIKIPNMDLDSMKALAKERYDEYIISGYRGSFKTAFNQFVQIGDIVTIKQEHSGIDNTSEIDEYKYKVKRVVYEMNMSSGLTQTITIDNRYITQEIKDEVELKFI